MNSFKKLAACFLCVCIVVCGICPATYAKSENDYSRIADILLKIGVMEEINADLNNPVTRGEFASMVSPFVSSAKLDGEVGMFADVLADNPDAGDIHLLAAAGIMNGYGDGTFRPDNHVTLNESLKVLATVLGYGPVANAWGGYPVAYIRAANRSELTENVSVSGNQELTYGEAIQLLYNTVTADMLQITVVSNDSVKVDTVPGETLLSVFFDIYQYDGILNTTPFTSLTGASTQGKGKIRVGNKLFSVDKGDDFTEYLGYYVDCYYKKDGSVEKALFLDKESGKNEELIVLADDIESVTQSGTTVTVRYYDENEIIRKQTVSINADVIYNGKAFPDWLKHDLELKSGYATFINNDSDSDIDVIVITEFETVVAKGISADDFKVYGTDGNNVLFDESELDCVKLIRSSGEKIKVSDIKQDNVLSVARSKDGKIVFAIMEDRGIIGAITVLEEENGEIFSCVVNDDIYQLTREYRNLVKTNLEHQRNFVLGSTLRFVITHDGKIAYSFSQIGVEKYGYLLDAHYGRDVFNTDEGKFQIFTQDGELIEVSGAKKIETNAGALNTKDTINLWDSANGLGFTDGSGKIVQQLVKFELNEKNELRKIYYATPATDNFEQEIFYSAVATSGYRADAKTLLDYTLGPSCYMFYIDERNSDGRVDPEDIFIKTTSLTSSVAYVATVYDFNYYKAPKAAVIECTSSTRYSEIPLVVQKVTKVMVDDNVKNKIVGLYNGSPCEYIVTSGVSLGDLEEGDGIFPYFNADNELSYFVKAFDVSVDSVTNRQSILRGSAFVGSALSVTVGTVKDYNTVAMGVKSVGTGYTGHSIVSSSKFYLYDSAQPKGKKVRTVTSDEMIPEITGANGSRVIVVNRYSSVTACMIIK